VGEVVANILVAPPSVRCISFHATTSSSSVIRNFDVTPGSSVSFALTGLTIGANTISAQAFNLGCANVGTNAATYVAEPVSVNVGGVTSVTLAMHPAGTSASVTATVTFPDPTGFVTEFALPGPSASIHALAPGPDGALWFLETSDVGKLYTTGAIITFPFPSFLGTPGRITAGPDGYMWLTGDNRIVKVTTDGSTFIDFAVPTPNAGVGGITTGGDGNLWFTETSAAKVGRYEIGTNTFTEFALPSRSVPSEITAGPDGNVWFTDQGRNSIERMTPTGTLTDFIIPTASSTPFGITVGGFSSVWFTELTGTRIGRITLGNQLAEFGLTPGSQPSDIAGGPDGNLWFVIPNSNKIGRFNPITNTFTYFGVPSSFALTSGATIVRGPDAGIWFTELGVGKIARITP